MKLQFIWKCLKKTIELKGTKNVEINTFGHDKERILVLLAIAGNDNKLPPLLIYKYKKGKLLENKLQKVKEVIDKKYLLLVNKIVGVTKIYF